MANDRPPHYDTRRSLADVRLGQEIRRLRLERNWSQADLADRLAERTGQRWDQVKVSNFETTRRLLSPTQLLQVAAVFDVPASVLVSRLDKDTDLVPCHTVSRAGVLPQEYPVERAGS